MKCKICFHEMTPIIIRDGDFGGERKFWGCLDCGAIE